MLKFIGDFIVSNAAVSLIGIIVIGPVSAFLGAYAGRYIRDRKAELIKAVDKIKDDSFRKLVEELIVSAEREIGSGNGPVKFKKVKEQIVVLFPKIVRPLIDAIIQSAFSELIKSGKI